MFWQSKTDEIEADRAAADLVETIEGLKERRTLIRFLVFCSIANLVVWLVTIVFASQVYSVMSRILPDKIGGLILGVPLGLGFFLLYCLCRLKLPDVEENTRLGSEMMATMTYQAHASRRWLVWIVSVIGGVMNVLLLILVDLFLAGEL